MPAVVNIRTESHQREQDLTEFFGGGGDDDLFRRFFGQPRGRGNRDLPDDRRAQAPASSSARKVSSSPTTMSSKAQTKMEVSLYGDDDDLRYKAQASSDAIR